MQQNKSSITERNDCLMIDTLETIMSEYYQNMEIYKKLKYDVGEIITTLIDINHIKISNMTLRIKSEEALKNKVISKAKYNHLDEISFVRFCSMHGQKWNMAWDINPFTSLLWKSNVN